MKPYRMEEIEDLLIQVREFNREHGCNNRLVMLTDIELARLVATLVAWHPKGMQS